MSESTDEAPPTRTPEEEAELRGKYLDYCSAQVADVLLGLTPDETYVLAQDVARAEGREGELSYDEIVRLATVRVTRKLQLPSFEQWAHEYATNPERFENVLMGLWRSERGDP